MAGFVMNKASKLIALFAGLLVLSACGGGAPGKQGGAAQKGDLDGARIGAPFTLIDQDGKTVHWDDFKGKYRLVYFGYTYCPDVCPLDLRNIMAGFRQLEKSDPAKAAKVQPIMISVDPTRDTPAVMKTYVSAFHPRLIGLTGPVDEIEKVKKAFVVVANKEGDQKATQDYLVSHTRTPFFFDPEGKPIALVPIDEGSGQTEAQSAAAVHDFLAKWVQ
jgi:protein SCO1/2